MMNTFLIVNCNDYKSTRHLVDNIKAYQCLDEIVIVDNDSSENEKEILATIDEENVHIIYNDKNDGYSSAINIGAKYLIEKYNECNIFISNSDIVIMDESDLDKMLACLNRDNIGLVGPQVLELGSISRGVKELSPIMDFWLTVPIIRSLISDSIYLYKDDYYDTDISYVDVISSSFFLIASDVLERINYMDELVFLYYEDYILSKKIRNLGLKVAVCNEVKVKHKYSVSVDKILDAVDKYKLLKKSQFYYHSTYNDANKFERLLLKANAHLGAFVRQWRK